MPKGSKRYKDDLDGKKFGKLQVLGFSRIKDRHAAWLCLCDCGITKEVLGLNLRRGHAKSCGCITKEQLKTHGYSRKSIYKQEYQAWQGMIQRCTNEKNPAYKNYGGRGIKVCAEWRYDFPKFLADMGPKPDPVYSLDRIDNDGNYEPTNCRWAEKSVQSKNRRTSSEMVRRAEIAAFKLGFRLGLYGKIP